LDGRPLGKTTRLRLSKKRKPMPNHSKTPELEKLLTIKQIAVLENTSERTIQRRIARGELQAIRYGRMLRIRPEDLHAFRLRRLLR
jgi:excisionase family DNA binding protein